LLVHEATYTEAVANDARNDFGHSTAASVARFAQAVGLPNLVLTHFSARYQKHPGRGHSIEDLRAEANALYSGQLLLAEDFMRLHLGKDGQLITVEASDPRSPRSLR
jgi:ribonuclease Z